MKRKARRAQRRRIRAYRKLGKAGIVAAKGNAALRQAQQVFNNAKLIEAIAWEASAKQLNKETTK